MRIECQSVRDFLDNLAGEDVFLRRVHVDVTQIAVKDHIHEIVFQASAVLNLGDQGQALVACGEKCGRDVATADGAMEGTRRAKELREMLEMKCVEQGLEVRPGILSE